LEIKGEVDIYKRESTEKWMKEIMKLLEGEWYGFCYRFYFKELVSNFLFVYYTSNRNIRLVSRKDCENTTMTYEIIVPYATETTTQMYKYYWWDK
jgi:hypothetical protein